MDILQDLDLSFLLIVIGIFLFSMFISNNYKSHILKIIPVSLVIGIIGAILINVLFTESAFSKFMIIAYHIFNLSVISLTLGTASNVTPAKRGTSKGYIWMAAIFTAVLCLQSISGYVTIQIMEYFYYDVINSKIGFLTGHAFAQGSGHVVAIGTIWEKEYLITGAISIGLLFSTIGYIFSLILALPLLKKNNIERSSIEIPSSSNFSYALLEIVLVYLITLIFYYSVQSLLATALFVDMNISKTISKILPGIVFAIGIIISLLYKKLFNTYRSKRDRINSSQKFLSTQLIDIFLIVTLFSINFKLIYNTGIIIIAILFIATLATLLLFYVLKKYSKINYKNIRLAGLVGTSFGSMANGFYMIKLLDPELKSPISYELTFMNILTAVSLSHITIIVFTIDSFDSMLIPAMAYLITLIIALIVAYKAENSRTLKDTSNRFSL